MSTDREWDAWGRRDPYFAVLTHPRFRRDRMTPSVMDEFFRIGHQEMMGILSQCRVHLGDVSTQYSLDFGCGVGRMLLPLSEMSEQCVGVDISEFMRIEAVRNLLRFNRTNVRLVGELQDLLPHRGRFTFVHSYIVLQHIQPNRGLSIISDLFDLLAKDGSAAIHVTYGRSKYAHTQGVTPFGRRVVRAIRRPTSRFFRQLLRRDPEMQMNAYDMNRVLFVAHEHGVRVGGLRLTDHGGHRGVILFLRKE